MLSPFILCLFWGAKNTLLWKANFLLIYVHLLVGMYTQTLMNNYFVCLYSEKYSHKCMHNFFSVLIPPHIMHPFRFYIYIYYNLYHTHTYIYILSIHRITHCIKISRLLKAIIFRVFLIFWSGKSQRCKEQQATFQNHLKPVFKRGDQYTIFILMFAPNPVLNQSY